MTSCWSVVSGSTIIYRVPQGNLHDVKGYGLGLYYVRNIMERMGGEVSVESTVGRGTEFTLSFPQNN